MLKTAVVVYGPTEEEVSVMDGNCKEWEVKRFSNSISGEKHVMLNL